METENFDEVNSKNQNGGTFLCESCKLSELYHYFGSNPRFHKGISFKEECYLMKDPFVAQGTASFLLLGSHCSLCEKVVCQASTCSIFYTKRLCLSCAKNNESELPNEILRKNLK